jgi:hypothetical protein
MMIRAKLGVQHGLKNIFLSYSERTNLMLRGQLVMPITWRSYIRIDPEKVGAVKM